MQKFYSIEKLKTSFYSFSGIETDFFRVIKDSQFKKKVK